MKIYTKPDKALWPQICLRPSSENPILKEKVAAIMQRVRDGGDAALMKLNQEIDGFLPESLEVSPEEVRKAASSVDDALKEAIQTAAHNISAFHKAQLPSEICLETAPGVTCIQRPVPIGKVGLYIPGGTAPLFSTVLMLALPAKIAGCPEVILCTPAGKDGKVNAAVLYAASVCGVDRIFKIGGAQAIAAMAYGTATVPKVHKIFGPGNQWVTTAKQLAGGRLCSIDMPAGPSEVMVIADDSSNPAFVAADLLSQAEHGRDSQVVLVCRSQAFAEAVNAQVDAQAAVLGRLEFVKDSLSHSCAVILDSDEDVISFADCYAPEHLIISTSHPWKIADKVTAAGSVFVGEYTPESAGDYASGTNHTLPTCAWAQSCSGVNIDSFIRKMTLQSITREGLSGLADTIVTMADAEGLQAHANAVSIRTDE